MDATFIYHVQPGPYWGWKVAVDLFLGGAGVGALLFAVAMHALFKGKYRRICQTAAFLAPLLITSGLIVLLAKLGQPLRLFYTFNHVVLSSPLWWGGILQTLLIASSVVYAFMWRNARKIHPMTGSVGMIAGLLALGVGIYHGLLLAMMNSHPLWNTGPTVVASILGFATTGTACVVLIHFLRMKLAGRTAESTHFKKFLVDMELLWKLMTGGLFLQMGTFFLWWLSLKFGTLADVNALAAANAAQGQLFWVVAIGIGMVVPLAISFFMFANKSLSGDLRVGIFCFTSLLILVGGLYFRLAMVIAGQAGVLHPILS